MMVCMVCQNLNGVKERQNAKDYLRLHLNTVKVCKCKGLSC